MGGPAILAGAGSPTAPTYSEASVAKLTLPRRGHAYPDDSIVLAYLTRGSVEAPFMESVLRSYEHDRYAGPGRFTSPVWRISIRSGVNVSKSRCKAVRQFLDTGAEWLWMVDDDMVWAQPDAHERLLASIDRVCAARPELEPWQVVMGGLCFAYAPDEDATYPTIFDRLEDGRFRRWTAPPPAGRVVQAAGTGAAFLIVHRRLLQAIDQSLGGVTQCPWFREHEQLIVTARDEAGEPTAATAYWVSEDLWFCDQVARVGGRVFVDAGVDIGHKKPHLLTRAFHERGELTVA